MTEERIFYESQGKEPSRKRYRRDFKARTYREWIEFGYFRLRFLAWVVSFPLRAEGVFVRIVDTRPDVMNT